mmetsp:Transcript_8170/g.26832  ORF Transcript_8170/g.26832 Transcript_8170/m.26832 type:complete len:83 (+) Transcript_8170:336-584(+)
MQSVEAAKIREKVGLGGPLTTSPATDPPMNGPEDGLRDGPCDGPRDDAPTASGRPLDGLETVLATVLETARRWALDGLETTP